MFDNQFPYLYFNEIEVTLDNWLRELDPSECAKECDGFRIVFGNENACKARSDGQFYRSLAAAVEAAHRVLEAHREAGQELGCELTVNGFLFNA